jgi:hypothetical protein
MCNIIRTITTRIPVFLSEPGFVDVPEKLSVQEPAGDGQRVECKTCVIVHHYLLFAGDARTQNPAAPQFATFCKNEIQDKPACQKGDEHDRQHIDGRRIRYCGIIGFQMLLKK